MICESNQGAGGADVFFWFADESQAQSLAFRGLGSNGWLASPKRSLHMPREKSPSAFQKFWSPVLFHAQHISRRFYSVCTFTRCSLFTAPITVDHLALLSIV